jgi:hypothetical protein
LFFLSVLIFEQGFRLAGQGLYHLSHAPTFFLRYYGLNSGPSPWATPPELFCDGFFWDRVSWTVCPGWLQTVIFLISASGVARIADVSHRHPAAPSSLSSFYKWKTATQKTQTQCLILLEQSFTLLPLFLSKMQTQITRKTKSPETPWHTESEP